MISDDKLRAFVDITASDVEKDEFASSSIRHTFLHALCKELLAYRESERKSDMLTDSAWIAGAKFGWNCGVVGDNNALQASIESRIRERAEDKKERPK